ncbi:DNA topoisomerase III [Flavobacterium zepuense]|uniref:DNA topoisomerase n=1 Tax=Flavobacterium zepuense TaxID=2593302 RepID=A0A552UZJ8_9FLAO|nr:type IA DNA topoisomerase [Flavobacterium zepuense]TRW23638.1 DNA topoisomerase III [Flavobacterium zepuense]
MIAVLAEKPSVARELAALLGATVKKEGYLEGNGYAVTWALGHLVALGLPEDYGIKGFQKESLPIIPSPFLLTPRKGSGKERLLPDKGILKQLVVIGELFTKCDSIIVATDAGREGELIFRYIYEYLNCRKPFERLWVSSLTEKALNNGLANLLAGSDFDNLYLAARARSRADWLVGINASQALSIAAGSGVYSLGRVQTPTLGLICKRYDEHEKFIPEKYWQLQLQHTKSFIDFKSVSVLAWDDKAQAEDALKSIQRKGHAVVTSVESETMEDPAPLLFDLTGLQKEANRKFGFTASETLEIAQGLYEKKFITYPRTGSKYITQDLWPELPGLIRGMESDAALGKLLSKVKFGRLNKHIVNEAKVTDHHGLLVTEKVPSALSVKEGTIYHMIALRLLEAVSESCVREVTDISLQVLHYDFKLKSSKVLEPGWRGIQEEFTDAEASTDTIPEVKADDQISITGISLLEKQTRTPELYIEASLLSAMEHVMVDTDDPKLKQAIKHAGLGTPATRAGIIEALLGRDYIERKGKALLPTPKGASVYSLVADKKISSATMTAEWELALAGIEEGELDSDDFQHKIESYARDVTLELLQVQIKTEGVPQLLCPRCNEHHLLITEKVVKCPEGDCGWLQFRKVCGVLLSHEEIVNLIKNKQTSVLKGMKSKSGKSFTAKLVLNEQSEVTFAFEK